MLSITCAFVPATSTAGCTEGSYIGCADIVLVGTADEADGGSDATSEIVSPTVEQLLEQCAVICEPQVPDGAKEHAFDVLSSRLCDMIQAPQAHVFFTHP